MTGKVRCSIFVLAFLLHVFPWLAECKNCETLDGKWYNQLGSEIFLQHGKDGKLLGEYRTAVERFNGSAGKGHSIILGDGYSCIIISEIYPFVL